MDVVHEFRELKSQSASVDTERLDELFDNLQVVDCASLYGGRWKGGAFQTGHKALAWLADIKWYGKEFVDQLDVKPLLCLGEDGELYSNQSKHGEASVWPIEFRDKVSAAMVYDGVPIVDHFRGVDTGIVMGIMTGKAPEVVDHGKNLYFYLERDESR